MSLFETILFVFLFVAGASITILTAACCAFIITELYREVFGRW
jgi:hypothetical protein